MLRSGRFTVGRKVLRRRRASLIWWVLGMVGMVGLLAVAYPTVRDNSELDRTFADLPPGVLAILGLGEGDLLTSPVGYLNSQFFANVLPVMLLIFAVGVAAWSVSGDEAAGTLELLLANPVGRVRVALERVVAMVVLLAGLTLVCAATLAVLAPSTGLDDGLPAARMLAATVACALLALAFAAMAFAVGAATGSRPLALGVASAGAAGGYLVEGLSQQVPALRPLRVVNPWHWLLDGDVLNQGLGWDAWGPPVIATVALVAAGTAGFARRDLR
jgi:ABC-2 type transport system permease protein